MTNIKAKLKNKLIPNIPKALPMRAFSPYTKEYTWEDWHDEMRLKYPIRHFLYYEFSIWCYKKYRKYIENPIYWIKSFIIRKDHLLDIRKAFKNNYDHYTWGYIDPQHILEYACVAAFNKYIEEVKINYGGINKRILFLEDQLKITKYKRSKKVLQEDIDFMEKVNEINYFFQHEVQSTIENNFKLLSNDNTKHLYNNACKNLNNKITENLIEIIKIRERFWT